MAALLDDLKAFAERAVLEISNHQEKHLRLPTAAPTADTMDVDSQESPPPDKFRVLIEQASEVLKNMEVSDLDTSAVEFTGEESDPRIPISDYRLTKKDVVAADDIWSIAHYLGDDYKKRIVSTPSPTIHSRFILTIHLPSWHSTPLNLCKLIASRLPCSLIRREVLQR
jgi:hypothetical protein